MDLTWAIVIVIVSGAASGFINVFIGDSGLHLPTVENGILRPGFLGNMLVGGLAALGSWAAAKAIVIFGGPQNFTFSTSDIATALIVGFGGAKWFKSETEKEALQQAAATAASKPGNQQAATRIATATPFEALREAVNM